MSDETLQEQCDRIVKAHVDALTAPVDDAIAEHHTARLTADAQLAATQLREQIRDTAIACGAQPRSVRHIVRDAEDLFELKDGQIVARDGRRNPRDPCVVLDLVAWLVDLRNTEGHLFVTQSEH
jgi:hypothetical protein